MTAGSSVVSKPSSLRDDRSVGETLSVASSDDYYYDDYRSVVRADKFNKQTRRGSGLGNIANYFKSSIKSVLNKGDHEGDECIPSQVISTASSSESGDHSSSSVGVEIKEHKSASERSPREFLDVMWRTRGYSRELYNTLDTAYFIDPSPLQLASYHTNILDLARSNEQTDIRTLFKAGISPNPSNKKGHSLMHEVCELGYYDLLSVLVDEFDASVQISDSDGQTPLHKACLGGVEGPFFGVVDILATKDRRMFSLKDKSGKSPLDMIPMEHWGAWFDFLYARRDKFWPRRLVRVDGEEEAPPLAVEPPKSRAAVDPPSALLTIDLAGLLVSGDITPDEAVACQKKRSEEAVGGEETSDDSCSVSGTE